MPANASSLIQETLVFVGWRSLDQVIPHAIEHELFRVWSPAGPDSSVWIDVLVNASNLHPRLNIVEFLGYGVRGLARFRSGEPALDAEIEFSGFGSLP